MTDQNTPGAIGSNDQLGRWQPIETAPKDGGMFLGWVGASKFGEDDDGNRYEDDCSQVDFCWWCTSEHGGYFDTAGAPIADHWGVTHWMPLPAPPAA